MLKPECGPFKRTVRDHQHPQGLRFQKLLYEKEAETETVSMIQRTQRCWLWNICYKKSRTTFRLAKSSAGSTSFQNIFSKQLSIISSDFTCSCAVFISFNDRLSYLAVLQLSQVVSSWLSSKMPEQHKEEILSLSQVLTQRHIPTGEQDNHYFAEIWTEIASIHSTLNWIWIDKKRNLLQFKEIQHTVVTWTIYLQMHI